MRALMVSVLAVAVSGCTFGIKTCTDTSECNPGSTCEEGFCVAPPDSGTGGGSTGGGAGGGTTGGGGGTTTGGGMGGGGGDSDGGAACALRTTSCPTGYECRETVPYEANCILAFESLALTVGDGGTALNTQAPTVNLQLVRKAGFNTADAPASVQVTSSGDDGGTNAANVAGAGGVYSGSVAVGGDGTFSFVGAADFTNEDGGTDLLTSNRATVALDTTPPSLTWQALDAGQYKRDDIIEVKVDSNEPVTGVTAWLNGVPLMNSPTCSGAAACFRANFSEPELAAMTATWQLTVAGNDLAGNVGDGGVATQVTRVRWVTQVPGGQDMRASPAVGPDGTIYVGTTNGASTSGLLAALNPAGVIAHSSTSFGGIISVAVSPAMTRIDAARNEPVVFLTSNTANFGELRGLPVDLGADGGTLQPQAASLSGLKTWSGLALTQPMGSTSVSAYATTTSGFATPGRLLRWNSSFGPTTYDQDQIPAVNLGSAVSPIPVGTRVPTAIGIVVSGTDAHLLTAQPTVGAIPDAGLFWRRFTSVHTTPALDTANAEEIETDTVSVPNGQALASGRSVIGVSANGLRVHSVQAASKQSGQPGGAFSYGTPAVANANAGFVGVESKLIRFDPSNLALPEVVVATAGGSNFVTSPVLGKAMNGRPATGYAVTDTGSLVVFDARPTGAASPSWPSAVPNVTSTVAAHPAFDCNRRNGAANTTTGILYIPFLDGNVAAIVVDSPRLEDAAGAWPKYQRTMGNAGNDDTTFFPTNWACP